MNPLWTYLGLFAYCYLSSIVFADKKDVKCPTLRLPGGKIRFMSKRKVARFSCDNGATLVGHDVAVCSNGKWTVPLPSCVANTCVTPSVDALVKFESFKNGGLLQFFCPPGYIRDGPETIACEAGRWDAKPPTCEVGMSQGCDFEDGLCGWSDDLTDDFNWSMFKGKTPTAETGPSADHTKKDPTGQYIFVESSAPRVTGHTARFLSPFYITGALDGKCLQFYYHMFGEDGPDNSKVSFLLQLCTIKAGEVWEPPLRFHYVNNVEATNKRQSLVCLNIFTALSRSPYTGWRSSKMRLDTKPLCVQASSLGDIAGIRSGVGDLDVYLRPDLLPTRSLGSDHQIFHKSGNQNDKWIKETVMIPKLTDPTQIVFQATIKKSWVSDIALDDILIADCDKIDKENKVTNDVVTSTQMAASQAADAEVKTQRSTAPSKTTKTTVKTTRQTTRATTKMTKSTTLPTTKPTTSTTPETTTTPSTVPTTTTRATTTRATTTVSTTALPTTSRTSARTTTSSTTRATTTQTSPTTVTTPSTPTSTTAEETTTIMSSTTDQTTLERETPGPSTAVENPEASSMETSAQPADATTDFTSSYEETTSDVSNATNTGDTPDEDYTNIDDDKKGKVDEDSEDNEDDETDNEGATNSTVGDNSEDEDSTNNDSGDSGNTDLQGNNVASGKVLAGDEGSSTKELLPLIIGVVSAVVVGAVVIGVLTWRWAKHQRMKQQKEEDDQMNIITEYVETTLN